MKSYLISLLSLAVQAKDICNALVLSGGGSNGAWEVGVMWGLSHNAINPEDFAWDYVTGISAGSINTSVISGFAPGHEKQMSEFLSQAFNEVANENVYQEWPEGLIRSFLINPSLLDDSPAWETLKTIQNLPIFEEGFKRNVTVAAVNVETGEFTTFSNKNTKWGEDWASAALSSGSVPGVFQPRPFNGNYYMDGGTVWNINIRSAIEGCLEVVDDLSKITIDIIFCTDGRENQEITETGTTVENYLRYRKIKYVHSGHDELTELLRSYPTVNWRYLFMEPYPGGAGGAKQLDFSPEITWPLQLIGRQHALDALAYGPGYGFDKLLGKIVE